MNRFDRIFELHRLLSGARVPVPHKEIESKLECSRATATRLIQSMREHLNAPIAFDRDRGGYYYDLNAPEGAMYELPGLWFNPSELHALLAMRELLRRVQPGLMEDQLAPVAKRIDKLLTIQHAGSDETPHRIRILGMATRPAGPYFEQIASAVVRRRRVNIRYYSRHTDTLSEREVSPQRLTHYRDAWYLDAYCHLRDDLRTFALEEIREAKLLTRSARQIPDERLDNHYAAAYGIFAGPADHLAILRFRPTRARWVAHEQWHPEQRGELLPDGSYELHIPYGNPTELILDVMRYGADVEVIAPEGLRAEVAGRLRDAAAQYGN